VQVVTEAGVPQAGEAISSKPSKVVRVGEASPKCPRSARSGAQTARNYGELFRRSLRGTDCNLLPRLPASGRSLPCRSRSGRWKGEGAEVTIDVLPEDPVEAFFVSEGDRAHRKKEDCAESSMLSGFSSLIWRHHSTLRRTSKVAPAQLQHLQPPSPRDQGQPLSPNSNHSPSKERPSMSISEDASEKGGNLGGFWDAVLDAVVPKQKIPPARKEACQMMRFFVYGRVGNEDAKTPRDSEKVFYECRGSKEEVNALFRLWQRLDKDNSGRVDIMEFRTFAEMNLREKMEAIMAPSTRAASKGFKKRCTRANLGQLAWSQVSSLEEIPEFVSRLCGKLAVLLLGKKSSFIMEDMMRLIWPCAQQKDLKVMRLWCRDYLCTDDAKRMKTPPLLPQADFQGLCSVFEFFDEKRTGTIRLEDLVNKGLIYEEQASDYFKQWDRNGDGRLDLLEFCEMMCPMGFRAHAGAESGSTLDGTRVAYDRQLQFWHINERADEVLASYDH